MEDQLQGWRLRHRRRRRALGRALDGDLCAALACPARGGRPGYWCRRGHRGCVTAGGRAGSRCGVTAVRGSGPRRCAVALEAAGRAAPPSTVRLPATSAAYGAALSRSFKACPRAARATARVRPAPHGPARRRPALEAVRRESCHRSERALLVLLRVMRDTCPPTDPRQSKARVAEDPGVRPDPPERSRSPIARPARSE